MAENKKKGAADDTASASRATSKGSKFSETLSKIVGLLGDLKSDTAGASDFEKMVENQKILDKDIKARDAEIKTLKLSIENLEHSQEILLTSFGKRYREYDDKLNNDEALKSTLAKAQESLNTALEEAKKLKKENKSLHAKVNKLEAALEKSKESNQASKAECDRLKLELGLSDANFDQISRFIGETKLVEFDNETLYVQTTRASNYVRILIVSRVTVFDAFAAKCHNLAVTCFRDNEVPTVSQVLPVENPRETKRLQGIRGFNCRASRTLPRQPPAEATTLNLHKQTRTVDEMCRSRVRHKQSLGQAYLSGHLRDRRNTRCRRNHAWVRRIEGRPPRIDSAMPASCPV